MPPSPAVLASTRMCSKRFSPISGRFFELFYEWQTATTSLLSHHRQPHLHITSRHYALNHKFGHDRRKREIVDRRRELEHDTARLMQQEPGLQLNSGIVASRQKRTLTALSANGLPKTFQARKSKLGIDYGSNTNILGLPKWSSGSRIYSTGINGANEVTPPESSKPSLEGSTTSIETNNHLPAAMRSIMRKVPHAVTIITAADTNPSPSPVTGTKSNSTYRGMTVSSFNTVSLHPSTDTSNPLVSFNVKLPSSTYSSIQSNLGGYFLAHLMPASRNGAAVANIFARAGTGITNVFEELEKQVLDSSITVDIESGAPIIELYKGKQEGTFTSKPTILRCRALEDKEITVGDHVVLIAEVLEVLSGEGSSNAWKRCLATSVVSEVGSIPAATGDGDVRADNSILGLLYVDGGYRRPGRKIDVEYNVKDTDSLPLSRSPNRPKRPGNTTKKDLATSQTVPSPTSEAPQPAAPKNPYAINTSRKRSEAEKWYALRRSYQAKSEQKPFVLEQISYKQSKLVPQNDHRSSDGKRSSQTRAAEWEQSFSLERAD